MSPIEIDGTTYILIYENLLIKIISTNSVKILEISTPGRDKIPFCVFTWAPEKLNLFRRERWFKDHISQKKLSDNKALP